jgi:hypothetical protein
MQSNPLELIKFIVPLMLKVIFVASQCCPTQISCPTYEPFWISFHF